jgi:hypothetical protein
MITPSSPLYYVSQEDTVNKGETHTLESASIEKKRHSILCGTNTLKSLVVFADYTKHVHRDLNIFTVCHITHSKKISC